MESVLNIKTSAFPAVEQSGVQLLDVLELFSECTETKRSRTEINLLPHQVERQLFQVRGTLLKLDHIMGHLSKFSKS